jgi:hypothetical protein
MVKVICHNQSLIITLVNQICITFRVLEKVIPFKYSFLILRFSILFKIFLTILEFVFEPLFPLIS